jgi:tetratricopeptide (TPR) repeat protein/predicted aspartyl protease
VLTWSNFCFQAVRLSMIKRPPAAALVGLVLSALSGRALATTCALARLAELPVTMNNLQPQVPAKINGADVMFLADTGAFYSLITPANAAQLHLSLHSAPFNISIRGVGGQTGVSVTTVTLGLAGQTLPGADFMVGGGETGPGVIGILGENLLGLGDGDYDLANGVIRLLKPQNCHDAALAYWDRTGNYSVISLQALNGSPWLRGGLTPIGVGEAYVNGAKIRVIFDTGASTSMLSLRAAEKAGVKPDSPGVVAAGFTRGVGRNLRTTWIAPFDSFKIGEEEIKHTRLRIGDIHLDDVDMLLGADFFLSHHVYFANSQHKIYFTYNGGPVFNLTQTAEAPTTHSQTGGNAQAGNAQAAAASAAASASPYPPSGPSDADGFARRGQAYASRLDYDKAIDDLTQAATLAPNDPQYLYERGLAYAANRQPFLAMQDFDAALKLKPDDVPALVARAEMRLGGRDKAGAILDLDAANRLAAKEADVRLTLGGVYLSADEFNEAVHQFDLWIEAHGDDSRMALALNQRCWTRAQAGTDLRKALADCNGALRLNGKLAAALDSRGLVRLRLGDNDGAIADYDLALRLEPKLAWSLYGRGLARLKKGLTAEGRSDIAAATELQPKLPERAKARGITP